MYIKEIIMLISWPISIYVSYLIISWAIRKFDNQLNKTE